VARRDSRRRLRLPNLAPRKLGEAPRAPDADEVETLIEAARGNRYGHRDVTMILLTYWHGLRAAEVCDLRRDEASTVPGAEHVQGLLAGLIHAAEGERAVSSTMMR
jgi:integrase